MSFLKKAAIIIIIALVLTLLSLLNKRPSSQKITINNTVIYVELAIAPEEKQRGLSGSKLQENQGMLFVFDNKTIPSFWMKDMLIPLDIIWIEDTKIVQIDENVPAPNSGEPDTNLRLYQPLAPINYVLEVNAGFSEKHGIKVGDAVDLSGIR